MMLTLSTFEELVQAGKATPPGICSEVSRMFHVRPTDVGLLWIDNGSLRFLFPTELQSAGTIPLSSSAVAARTAVTRQADVFNQFPKVPHHSIFERIQLSSDKPLADMPDPIQKLMSAPIIGADDTVTGVIQVCRKGMTPGIAGADFTVEDLSLLCKTARSIGMLKTSLDAYRNAAAAPGLRFHSTNGKVAKKVSA